MGSNSSSFILELAILVVGSLINIGVNFLNIVSNRRHAKLLKREEEEAARREEEEQSYRALINKHERMLSYLKWSGYFRRGRGEKDSGFDDTWDS